MRSAPESTELAILFFEEAFEICKEQAQPGDAVLLSPACASWGMFPNYEARGRLFKELVKKMGAKE